MPIRQVAEAEQRAVLIALVGLFAGRVADRIGKVEDIQRLAIFDALGRLLILSMLVRRLSSGV